MLSIKYIHGTLPMKQVMSIKKTVENSAGLNYFADVQ